MEFSFRDLVELLEIDAPIHFTPKENLNRHNYVFCKYMGNDECAAIIAGNHDMNTQYDNSDVGLHFPDIGIEEYFGLENSRNPAGIQTHIREVSSLA